ncbi:MucR family transcriptional regulator [Phaeospirillum tilakii]|uniref:MucR family transcriptional regulator n=1 Tax=Phaeospirillum tilakii TaxID=741673 RepID=A0ABW5C666_9PROT
MIDLTAKIVAAYLRNHPLATAELPELIRTVHTALQRTETPAPEPAERQQPMVSVRKSVTPDAIVCLECGKPQKMLKRHIATAHGLTVDQYRAKWSLPSDYPMVAPSYAAHRSQLAKAIGLGTSRKRDAAVEAPATGEAAGEGEGEPAPHRYPASRWSKPVG